MRCPHEEGRLGLLQKKAKVSHGSNIARLPYIDYTLVSSSELLTKLRGAVVRGVIGNMQNEISVGLRKQALQSPAEECRAVGYRKSDGEIGRCHVGPLTRF